MLDVCQQANVPKVDLATETAEPEIDHAAANPAAQKAQFVEGEPAHLVHLSRVALVVVLLYFAARQGLLGKQIQKISVEMVKEKPPRETQGAGKAQGRTAQRNRPKWCRRPKGRGAQSQAPPPAAPPTVAPPAAELPSFDFDGGKAVDSSSDPVQLYKGVLEYALRSKWDRPDNMDDDDYVAEVQVAVDRDGQHQRSGLAERLRQHALGRFGAQAIDAVTSMDRPPPTNFPPHVVIRFDVQQETEPVSSDSNEKNFPQPSQFAERIEHHAAAGPGVRAAGHFHHHHAADDEQPGNDPAVGQTAAQDQRPKPKINRIAVDAKGQTLFERRIGHHPQLKDKLQQLKPTTRILSVVVKGADDVDYQNMINVLDVLQQLDITKVGLATEEVDSAQPVIPLPCLKPQSRVRLEQQVMVNGVHLRNVLVAPGPCPVTVHA